MPTDPTVRLLGRVLRHRRPLVLTIVYTVLYALVSGISLGMILPFADLLFSKGVSMPPALPETAGAMDRLRHTIQVSATSWFFTGDPHDVLRKLCALLVVAFAVKGVFSYLLSAASVTLEERVLKDLRDDLFEHLQELSMGWFARRRGGELLSRATNDVDVVRKGVSSLYRTAPRDALLCVVYLAVVVLASWRLALLCFAVFPALAVLISVIGRRIRKYSTRAQMRMGDLASIFQESIGGIRVVKAFGGERHAIGRFREATEGYLRSAERLRRVASLASPAAELAGALGAVLVLWAGGNQVLAGQGLSATWFVIFLAATVSLMQPVRGLSQLQTHLKEGDAAARRIFEILDTPPTITDREGARDVRRLERAITFENVSFAHDPDVPVIRDVNLTIRRGEVVALVGPSGAGKSTLADMIPRFHDPDTGRVAIDDTDLRDVKIAGLRALLGVVTQDTILFHDTVSSNIAFADPAPDQARVEEAARAANVHDFVAGLPRGYDTIVGDRGVRLSGGERQRIAIARAIYRNPQILILDEATSSLDGESEAKVQQALDRLMEGRTSVVIAHRLSTVRDADRIVVLEGGRVAESGTHDELLHRHGVYSRLYERQFSARLAPDPAAA
ncbi:MAG: ABC transporter ATP-binding protein [bacterium]